MYIMCLNKITEHSQVKAHTQVSSYVYNFIIMTLCVRSVKHIRRDMSEGTYMCIRSAGEHGRRHVMQVAMYIYILVVT